MQHSTWCHNQEGQNLNTHNCENFKSHKHLFLTVILILWACFHLAKVSVLSVHDLTFSSQNLSDKSNGCHPKLQVLRSLS